MQEITNSIYNLNAKMLLHTIDESIQLSKNAMINENQDTRLYLGDAFCFGINPAEKKNLSVGQDKYSTKRLMEAESTCLHNLIEKNKKKIQMDNKFLEQFHGLCEIVSEAESIAFDFEDNDADSNCLFFDNFGQENEVKLIEDKVLIEEETRSSKKSQNMEIVKLRNHSSENLSKSTNSNCRKNKNTNSTKKGISKKNNQKMKNHFKLNSKESQKEKGEEQFPISQDSKQGVSL